MDFEITKDDITHKNDTETNRTVKPKKICTR